MRIARSVVLVSVVTMLAAGALVNAAQAQGDPPPAVPGGKSVTTDLYTVKDGNQVDPKTLAGWKTWRAMACERCHGASQEGLVGPALVNSLKVLTKDQFHTTVTQGRLEKGMPNFGGVQLVVDNWQNLYAYLKGRSDGNIAAGHLYPIQADQKSAKK
ncbi:MAG TPA: cytochrome c [Steroidobacteraceae bacterium]|nr:cytochrome c [Steroidobacteraceae bacterium]